MDQPLNSHILIDLMKEKFFEERKSFTALRDLLEWYVLIGNETLIEFSDLLRHTKGISNVYHSYKVELFVSFYHLDREDGI